MITGYFGPETENAVKAFQQEFNLPQTGIVGAETWDQMYNVFKGIVDNVFINDKIFAIKTIPYGGKVLKLGSRGPDVKALQEYLNGISLVYQSVTPVAPTGVFNRSTQQSVLQYQSSFNLPLTGTVDRIVWNSIANTYKDVTSANTSRPEQYPGRELSLGDSDTDNLKKIEFRTYAGCNKF